MVIINHFFPTKKRKGKKKAKKKTTREGVADRPTDAADMFVRELSGRELTPSYSGGPSGAQTAPLTESQVSTAIRG